LAGTLPTVAEVRAFVADPAPGKRTTVIAALLARPAYAERMANLFHVLLMERLGDQPEWQTYLRQAFAANRPWHELSRDILGGAVPGARFWLAKRLDHYGQNPVDYPGLTRDVGRLFLGVDFRCAQCHDHLFIKTYKQADYQGLFAFVQTAFLHDAKTNTVAEKLMTQKVGFASVFSKQPKEIGPRVPGRPEVPIPTFPKGEEYRTPPDKKTKQPGPPKFSPLAQLAQEVTAADNVLFARNVVNRLWWAFLGRGLVHPLDWHHRDNPPTHPELLDLLAREFGAHGYDLKWLVRTLVLTQTYQRSSQLPAGVPSVAPEQFAVALERRLSAEQLFAAVGAATANPLPDSLRAKFLKAFANAAREPEDGIEPSLKAALFVLNDEAVLHLLEPTPTNRVGQLLKCPDAEMADELYLGVLSRWPRADERTAVTRYLAHHAAQRARAVQRLTWALLASVEFGVNH
jgi:hypothetical protein